MAVNPHSAVLDAGLAYLKELEAATDFVLGAQGNRTTIYSKPAGQDRPTNMPITKGQAKLAAAISIDQVIDSLRNPETRKAWDKRFEGMELIEKYPSGDTVIHSLQHGQWPVVSGRDFCLTFRSVKESESKAYLIFASAEDARVPEVKGRVRAKVYLVGWVIDKNPDADGWLLTYFSHVDPVGLPQALLSLIASETPACAGTFASYVEKNGPSPAMY
ncbi:hypothetical protein HDU84_007078 [Entophlyctis sp. JEL0112]|nr:hypothetical protein HDU84_007078 [Entophlyctis sp. JEL0112]